MAIEVLSTLSTAFHAAGLELTVLLFFALGFLVFRTQFFQRLFSRRVSPANSNTANLLFKQADVAFNSAQYEQVLNVWSEMQAQNITPSIEMLLLLVKTLAQFQQTQLDTVDVLITAMNAHPELCRISTANALLNAVCRHHGIKAGQQLFDRFASVKLVPDVTSYEVLISGYAHHKEVARASELLSESAAAGLAPTEPMYASVIRGAIRIDDVALALRTTESMLAAGLSLSGRSLVSLLSFLARHNRMVAVFSLLDSMKSRLNLDVLNAVLDTCVNNNNATALEKIVQKMHELGFQFDSNTYSLLVKGWCNAQRMDKAREVFAEMKTHNCAPSDSTFHSLLSLCAAKQDVNTADALLQEMKSCGVRRSLITYSTLMKVYAAARMFDKAVNEVPRLMEEDGIEPDEIMYGCLMNFAVEINQTDRALQFYKIVRDDKKGSMNLSVMNYMSLIRGCGRARQLDKAFDLFAEMKANGNTPDDVIYNCLLDACVQCGDMKRATDLLEEMKAQTDVKVPDVISFNTLIKGYQADPKQLGEAFRVFDDLKKQGLKPNDVTYNSLIDACVRAKDTRRAWDLFDEMQNGAVKPDNYTCSILIKGIREEAKPAQLDKAFKLLETMTKEGGCADEVLFNCLIDACVRLGDLKRALMVFDDMKKNKIDPSAVTYGTLIKAYGQNDQLGKAFEMFDELKRKKLRANDITYGCLLDACVRNNKIDKAEEVFNLMKQDGIQGNTVVYSTMIKGFCRTRQLDRALEVYEIMKREGVEANNVTFNSLLDACARCQDLNKAWELYQDMRAANIPADIITYSTIIKGYCRVGKLERAFGILETMKSQGIKPDEILFNSLMDGCAQAGDLDLALKLFDDMREMNIKPSNVTFSILVKLYGRAGQIDKAVGILTLMEREYHCPPGKVVYTCVIQACIRNRQLNKAVELFNDMTSKGVKGDHITYGTLINGCCYAGQLDRAAAFVSKAADEGVSLQHEVLQNLADQCQRKKKPELAARVFRMMRDHGAEVDNRAYTRAVRGTLGHRQ